MIARRLRILAVFLFAGLPAAGAAEFTAAVHYQELFQAQPVETGDKIEVRELFWYGCPHCYDLEPHLDKWLKTMPPNAAFVRMPAVLRDSWSPGARAYYAFAALGALSKLHGTFFKAIHGQKRKNLVSSPEAIADFAAENGVDRQKFLDAYNSFAIDSKARQAAAMVGRYEADGVPTIVVDGRYRTSPSMAGGHERLGEIIDFLIRKAAAERTATAGASTAGTTGR